MMQVEFYNHGCKAFFKKYGSRRKVIVKAITEAITKEVNTGMTKVKLASRQRINGQSIYEFRMNLGKIGSARLAFSASGERVVVYFITTNLQKAVFSTAFEHLIGSIRKQYAAGSK